MELVIRIVNWDKHQPRTDKIRHPYWFKIKNDIASNPVLFGWDCETKWLWICLLAEASKSKGEPFLINVDWLANITQISKKSILRAIDTMQVRGIIESAQSTRNAMRTPLALEEKRLEENRIYEQPALRPVFDFESIYEKYPRRLGKKKGIAICLRSVQTPKQYEDLMAAVNNYATYCRREKIEPRFIKHFSTFMNSWEDWVDLPVEARLDRTSSKPVEMF